MKIHGSSKADLFEHFLHAPELCASSCHAAGHSSTAHSAHSPHSSLQPFLSELIIDLPLLRIRQDLQ